jgi:hypothetical protein
VRSYELNPGLDSISHFIPDDEIDFLFPKKTHRVQGPSRRLKSSQLYRAHILSMQKGIYSFKRLSEVMKHHRPYREFCLLANQHQSPTMRMFSEFRSYLGASGFREISHLLFLMVCAVIGTPDFVVGVPDATDLPASCQEYSKKRLPPKSIRLSTRLKEVARKRQVNLLILLGIKNIP